MAAEKTKVKSYRLRESTLQAIDEMAAKSERKHNWVVQKILDMYIQNKKNKDQQ